MKTLAVLLAVAAGFLGYNWGYIEGSEEALRWVESLEKDNLDCIEKEECPGWEQRSNYWTETSGFVVKLVYRGPLPREYKVSL